MIKNKITIVLVFLGIIILSMSVNHKKYQQDIHDYFPIPSSSDYITLDYKIHIQNNWSETVATYDWCTGSGTEEDPYVIEGISIDLADLPKFTYCDAYECYNHSGAAIRIEDSQNFIIRNCNLSHAGLPGPLYNAGIYLIGVENGVISNCTLYKNCNGIVIKNSEYVQILNNFFIGSHTDNVTGMGKAMEIDESQEITIQSNFIDSYYEGIVVFEGSENIIVDNNTIINYEHGYMAPAGISFWYVTNGQITNNDLYGVTTMEETSQSSLKLASLGSNPILLHFCHNILVKNNRFFDLNGNLIVGEKSIDFILILAGSIGIIAIGSLVILILVKRSKQKGLT